jgi:hypothetical protein
MLTWHSDPAVETYVEERLTRGIYKGIGKFHLMMADQAETPVVKCCAELAVQRQLFLHAHVDDPTVEKLLQLSPRSKFFGLTSGCLRRRRRSVACSTAFRPSGWSWPCARMLLPAARSILSDERFSCVTKTASR